MGGHLNLSAKTITFTPMALHHAPLLNELYQAAPGYFALLGNHAPNFTEVQQDVEIALLDPRRHLELLHDQAGQLVGILDYKTGYPQPSDLTINLLLIREDQQNQRLGAQTVMQLEGRLPPGTKRILAGVLGENLRGVRFWKRLGYTFELDARPAMCWYAKRVGQTAPQDSLGVA